MSKKAAPSIHGIGLFPAYSYLGKMGSRKHTLRLKMISLLHYEAKLKPLHGFDYMDKPHSKLNFLPS